MRHIHFYSLLLVFVFSTSFAQITESDKLFKRATDFVKEKRYTEAVSIFQELARNNEHDAQYNLAFLINGGKGITKNYSEALFWAILARLGQIEKAKDLTEDLIEIVPEKVLEDVREKVLEHLLVRFDNKDEAVLTELGDFYLLVLDEQDFENAYLWYNVASALGVENSGEVRDKVEKELEPDTIVKMQVASRKRYEEFTENQVLENEKKTKQNKTMKVKVHWVIDGIAEVEAESLEDAEKIVNERLSDFVSSNPDLEKKMGAKAIQGKGYLPGSEEQS